MLVAKGLAATGAILVSVVCAASGTMAIAKPKVLWRAMSESVFLLQLGAVMMSMAHVTTGGHRNHAC